MEINLSFEKMVASLRKAIQTFPDKRTGNNVTYSLEDAALGAFSVFFTQCPSFLVYQKAMEDAKGQSNAQTIFQMKQRSADEYLPVLLVRNHSELVFAVFYDIFQGLNK